MAVSTENSLVVEGVQLPKSVTEYLCVDDFLNDFMDVQALQTAFSNGLIEQLKAGPQLLAHLCQALQCDAMGLSFLLGLLQKNSVIEFSALEKHDVSKSIEQQVLLTESFKQASQYQALMQVKIEFANFLAPDLMQGLPALVRSEAEFMAGSRLFELFDYEKALTLTPDNKQFTQRWVSLTTALTAHESEACLVCCDISMVKRWLDIGGNSGEFARHIAQANTQVQVTVVDLPVVCDIGREYIDQHTSATEANRIHFLAANALEEPLPCEQDVVSFKSFLHDWPEEACELFLQQAYNSLHSGGRVLIFERAATHVESLSPLRFGNLSTLLFFRSYRSVEVYAKMLSALGFVKITIQKIPLETDFLLITAVKP